MVERSSELKDRCMLTTLSGGMQIGFWLLNIPFEVEEWAQLIQHHYITVFSSTFLPLFSRGCVKQDYREIHLHSQVTRNCSLIEWRSRSRIFDAVLNQTTDIYQTNSRIVGKSARLNCMGGIIIARDAPYEWHVFYCLCVLVGGIHNFARKNWSWHYRYRIAKCRRINALPIKSNQ